MMPQKHARPLFRRPGIVCLGIESFSGLSRPDPIPLFAGLLGLPRGLARLALTHLARLLTRSSLLLSALAALLLPGLSAGLGTLTTGTASLAHAATALSTLLATLLAALLAALTLTHATLALALLAALLLTLLALLARLRVLISHGNFLGLGDLSPRLKETKLRGIRSRPAMAALQPQLVSAG